MCVCVCDPPSFLEKSSQTVFNACWYIPFVCKLKIHGVVKW